MKNIFSFLTGTPIGTGADPNDGPQEKDNWPGQFHFLRRDQGVCSGHLSLFQKIAKLSLKAAILKLGNGYYKIRPLNISRIPCNMHGEAVTLQCIAALQFKNLFTECSQIVFAITFNNNFSSFCSIIKE